MSTTKIRVVACIVLLPPLMAVAGCAGQPAAVSQEREAEDSRTIGFRDKQDLFECYTSDAVKLEEADGRPSMRWDITYAGKHHRACVKELKAGTASGMTSMRFKVRSDASDSLWIQVNEAGGEGFYQIITPSDKWQTISIKLADLKLNDDKVDNRQLDVDQITKLLVIDASALEGKSGKRTVWFADWEFNSPDNKASKSEPSSVSKTRPPSNTRDLALRLDAAQLHAKVDSVLPKEEEERWLRIPWRQNLMQARLESQRAGKPMLIWVMDGNVLGCT